MSRYSFGMFGEKRTKRLMRWRTLRLTSRDTRREMVAAVKGLAKHTAVAKS